MRKQSLHGSMLLLAGLLATGCVSGRFNSPLIEYDDLGRPVSRVDYNSDGSIRSVTTYQYPSAGITVETEERPTPSGGQRVARTYHLWDTKLSYRTIYTYDAEGNELDRVTELDTPPEFQRHKIDLPTSPAR